MIGPHETRQRQPQARSAAPFLPWAHAASKLRTNVAAGLKLTPVPRGTRPKGLLAAEVQALLRAAGQSRRTLARRNYAIVQLLLQVPIDRRRFWISAQNAGDGLPSEANPAARVVRRCDDKRMHRMV